MQVWCRTTVWSSLLSPCLPSMLRLQFLSLHERSVVSTWWIFRHQSSLFTNPSQTADGFAEQLRDVVTEELDKVAPMKTSRRRPSKPITKFLSPAAKTAKRKRRRLERTWKSTGLESDRIAYRKSCRETNRLINDSRRDFMRDQISEETDPKLRWRTVKHLLHSGSTDSTMSTDECSNLCATFSSYFVNKINNLKHSILNKLGSFTVKPQFVDQPHTGPQFQSIPLVTPAEVRKLLSSIPS